MTILVIRVAVTLAMAVAIAQPQAEAASPSQRSTKLPKPGTQWEVLSVGHERAPRRSKSPAATLFMAADGMVGGTWECNGGGSAYVRWTKTGEFTGTGGPIIFTAMGCGAENKTDFAGKFWRLMGKARRWERSGKLLTIHANDGSIAHLRLMSELR